MSQSTYFDNIQKYMFLYTGLISNSNSLGLTDKSVNAENVFKQFLNIVFDWNLENENAKSLNQDSFDLFDRSKNIYVQVTSNKKHSLKKKNSITSFKEKYKSKTKKRFIILFISTKCSSNILKSAIEDNTTFDTYDIPTLLKKLYHENSNPIKLKKINELLQFVVYPVLIKSDINIERIYPISINQAIPVLDRTFHIDRHDFVESLFEFAQEANGLLIGGHGFGKSFAIEELKRLCITRDVPCFIIRINDLVSGLDEDINNVLGANGNWLEALANYTPSESEKKGILVFDAFDTAKDGHLKQIVLRQVSKAIDKLHPRWSVLASVRTFDATKSPQLNELFPTKNLRENVSCRYIEIYKLSVDELENAVASEEKLSIVYRKASPGLREILNIPYFLCLLRQILISEDVAMAEIIQIDSEEQLLSFFWKVKVEVKTARDLFLNKLTASLISDETLTIEKLRVLNEGNSATFDDLCSDGLIIETSLNGRRITYSHNILLDFAMSKYVLPEEAARMIPFVAENERLPFIFRQGFFYFYSRLWQKDRVLFWQHYSAVRKENTSLFRLYHQTILNYVAVEFYKSLTDLRPIFDETDADEKGELVRKLLEAIRFVNKEIIKERELELFHSISRVMHRVFLWEFGKCLSSIVSEMGNKNKLNDKNWKVVADTICNYWEFVLSARHLTPQHRGAIDNNGGAWGLDNLSAVHFVKKFRVQKLISKTFSLLNEIDFPINFFRSLGDNILNFFNVDKAFAMKVYWKIYAHDEKSDKETYFGTAAFSMKSSRAQDFRLIHYKLETDFPKLLALDPVSVLPLGVEILNKFGGSSFKSSYGNIRFPIKFNSVDSYFTLDGSHRDIVDDEQYEAISHGSNIFKLFCQLAVKENEVLLDELIALFVKHAHTCNAWRRFIKFLGQFPKLLAKTAFVILQNESLFLVYETTEEAGALLASVWPYLSVNQRKIMERLILCLKTPGDNKQNELQDLARISRLINCIPKGMVELASSHAFMRSHTAIANKISNLEPVVANVRSLSKEEQMRREGLSPENAEDIEAYNILQEIGHFNSKFDTGDCELLKRSDADILSTLKNTFLKVKAASENGHPRRSIYDYAISRAIKIFLKSNMKFKKSESVFLREVAFYYLNHPSYLQAKYQTRSSGSGADAPYPAPRIEAVRGIICMLNKNVSEDICNIILVLAGDNEPMIRHSILHAISWFWHNDRKKFWPIVVSRSYLEEDDMCLQQIIRLVSHTNLMEENVVNVEEIAEALIPKLLSLSDVRTKVVWSSYSILVLRLRIRHKSMRAATLILNNIRHDEFCFQIVRHIIETISPPEDDNDKVFRLNKYDYLIEILLKILDWRFEAIASKGLASTALRDDFKIVDECIQQLCFVFKGWANKKNNGLSIKDKKTFYFSIREILNKVADKSVALDGGFMVAHTGYYFLQLLNEVFRFDDEHVLALAFRVVNSAAANGITYDQTTLGEVVKLTDVVLTDHPHLLKSRKSFNELLEILDRFAHSGWQEAFELTWRLKEAF